MQIAQLFLTHIAARKGNKSPFFFSRFNFERMKERGNTHYCFHCGGQVGFKLGPNGELLDYASDGYNPMKRHNPITHADGIIGDADKFTSPWEWLEKKIPSDFPFIVTIPQV